MLASALIEDTSRAEHTELALKAGARSIDTRGGFGRVAAEKGVLVQQKHLTNPVVSSFCQSQLHMDLIDA